MWHGSLLCWKTERDKRPHTSADFLFSLYMTGRVQADSTRQHYSKFPHTTSLLPHFPLSSWIVFTDFVLQRHITAQYTGQGSHVLCKHWLKPWHQFHGALRTVLPGETYIVVFVHVDSLISLKLHYPKQISKCIVYTLTDRVFPNTESWRYLCRNSWIYLSLSLDITQSQMWSCLGSRFDIHTYCPF